MGRRCPNQGSDEYEYNILAVISLDIKYEREIKMIN